MNKIYALIALILFAPVFSIGVVMSLFIAPGTVGNTVFTLMKVWGVALPLLWTMKTNRQALRFPKFKQQEVKAGLILGILMFGVIMGAYFLIGQQTIDLASIRAKAAEVGIVNPYLYLAGCVYWSFINSLIEECTWRGFAVSQCKILVPEVTAVILAALLFTMHHSIALYGYTHDWLIVLLGSLGVFLAGAIWAWCYSYYKSIIPGYISHILADIAIALIGYQLLFL
ncbi:MAG: type II CAAX endopeptidase family protein [Cyanobacteria bacterium P01_G01_bin.39]